MIRTKCLIFLLLSLLLCYYSLGYEVFVKIDTEDPKSTRTEIESCKRRCETEGRGERQLQQCQQHCEGEAIKKREREQQEGQEGKHHSERQTRDPERQFQECRESCLRQSPRQQPQCESRCRQQYEDQKRHEGEERGKWFPRIEEGQSENPYYFPSRRLQTKFENQHGSFKAVERFNRRSQLLRGIENYRVVFLEARGNAFILPHHCDAEAVAVVLRGKSTFTLVARNNKETHNVERGDVIRLRSGTTIYAANRDEKENLRVVILAQPVNTPGHFEEFFGVGGEQSFFNVFSDDILESSFDVSRDQIDKLWGQQKQRGIVRASREQIEALSRHASTQRRGRESSHVSNLLQQKPVDSNRYGRYFEANPEEFDQLKEVNLFVNYLELKQGSLLLPHYNAKSTVVAVIEQGRGRIEMACPHVGRQGSEGGRWSPREEQQEEESEGGSQFQKVSTELSPGDVFIIPAGHPHALVSTQNDKLRAVFFGINGWNNQKNFLAGRDNILNQVEKEAKELSFNAPSEQVDEVLGKEKESRFVQWRGQRREREMGKPLASILDWTI